MPLETYLKITPALQVATLLLQRARPFLLKIMFGKLTNGNYLDSGYQANNEQERKFDIEITKIARNLRFFSKVPSLGYLDETMYGVTVSDLDSPYGQYPITVAVNPAYYDAVNDLSWPFLPPEVRHRFLFHLANTLVHETAHVIWRDRMYHLVSRWDQSWAVDSEPCSNSSHVHPASQGCELGAALENFLYQGRFHFLNGNLVSKVAMQDLLWQQNDEDMNMELPFQALVQTESISRFFCAGAWTGSTIIPLSTILNPSIQFEPMRGSLGSSFTGIRRGHT